MNKNQIQLLMSFIRPAIYNLYGRQPLKMSAYNIMDKEEYFPYVNRYDLYIPSSIWIQVKGNESYKLKVERGEVVSIARGTLNI